MPRLGLALVGLLATLAVGEVAVRALELEPPPLWRFDRSVGWTYQPRLRTWYTTREFRTWVEINSAGLHDLERPVAKAPGVFRILMLGDSFTAALEVPFEASFSRLLERRLATAGPAGVEVVNAGVGGYSTVNELLLYRQLGAKYQPDLVVLNFNDADIRDNHPRLADNAVPGAPYFELAGTALQLRRYPQTLTTGLARMVGRLRVARLAHRVALSLGADRASAIAAEGAGSAGEAHRSPSMSTLYRDPRTAEWAQALTVTRALIRELARDVTSAGGRLAVVSLLSLEPGPGEDQDRRIAAAARLEHELSQFFDGLGVPHLSLSQRLHDAERRGIQVRFRIDRHFNAEGHKLVAGLLEEFLVSRGLVPTKSSEYQRPDLEQPVTVAKIGTGT